MPLPCPPQLLPREDRGDRIGWIGDKRADLKLVLALEHFVIKKFYLSWRLGDRFQNVFDGRNELPTKNTTTLKKSFPKSIKNSSRNQV